MVSKETVVKGVAVATALGVASLILQPITPISITKEPDKHRQAREQIKVYSQSWGGGYLEWYLVRIMEGWLKNGEDQVTCMYFLIFPGKEWEGDIEGILEIYNDPEEKWSEQETVKTMVCEFTRLTWAEEQIKLSDGRIFEIPEVMKDEEVTEGFVTFRVNVE